MKHRSAIPLAIALIGVLITGCKSDSAEPVGSTVSIQAGAIEGEERDDNNILAFKGIPYAQPPTDNLRWRKPQPVEAWEDTRDTQAFGAPCVAAFGNNPAESEDCLTLNVWTGAENTGEKRPVMVWIHGGGFVFGSSAETNGRILAQKDVVVVSMNYRLGVFGFLADPWPGAAPSIPTNLGLTDQVAALKWVRTNISKFGGDPNNVTVFGESAGAHAIGLLMASPSAQGLFDKAILESGAFWGSEHGSMSTQSEAQDRSQDLAQRLNVQSLSELRDIPAQKLKEETTWNIATDPGITVFTPHVDGDVVPDVPAKRFANAQQMDIPIITGWNQQEERPIFVPRALPNNSAQAFRDAARDKFPERTQEFFDLYPASSDEQATASAHDLIGDLIISQQTWEAADSQRRVWNAPVYIYNFTYTSDYSPVATHASEIPFVFGTLESGDNQPAATASDEAISDAIQTYWTNFAKTGTPNEDTVPQWPVYESTGINQLELGNSIQAVENPRQDRFEFIKSLRTKGVLPTEWRNINVQSP